MATHLEAAESSWLDLHRPTADDLAMLSDVFKSHPLAVEDATHFMPPTWLTGFLGMDFERLVLGITGWPALVLLGLVTQTAAVAIMSVMSRRRRWI